MSTSPSPTELPSPAAVRLRLLADSSMESWLEEDAAQTLSQARSILPAKSASAAPMPSSARVGHRRSASPEPASLLPATAAQPSHTPSAKLADRSDRQPALVLSRAETQAVGMLLSLLADKLLSGETATLAWNVVDRSAGDNETVPNHDASPDKLLGDDSQNALPLNCNNGGNISCPCFNALTTHSSSSSAPLFISTDSAQSPGFEQHPIYLPSSPTEQQQPVQVDASCLAAGSTTVQVPPPRPIKTYAMQPQREIYAPAVTQCCETSYASDLSSPSACASTLQQSTYYQHPQSPAIYLPSVNSPQRPYSPEAATRIRYLETLVEQQAARLISQDVQLHRYSTGAPATPSCCHPRPLAETPAKRRRVISPTAAHSGYFASPPYTPYY
ncbi:hypothetical protein RI367_007044 [Sorochytrium milnesiophthora]